MDIYISLPYSVYNSKEILAYFFNIDYTIDDVYDLSALKLLPEVEEWLKDNKIKYRISSKQPVMTSDGEEAFIADFFIIFNSGEDVMAFKLRWG